MLISGSSFHPVPNFRTWFQTGYMDPNPYPMVLTRPARYPANTGLNLSTHNINIIIIKIKKNQGKFQV